VNGAFALNGVIGHDGGVVTCKNSIFVNATGISFPAYTSGNGITSYSCFYSFSTTPTGTGNITSDPLFVDPSNSNFNLRATSPCIATGTLV
jgi:hypothetical protein